MKFQLQLPRFFSQDLFKSNKVQKDSIVAKFNFDLKNDNNNDSKQNNKSKKTILISNNDLNNSKVYSRSNNNISSNENHYPTKDVFYKNYVFINKNLFNFLVDTRFDKVRS